MFKAIISFLSAILALFCANFNISVNPNYYVRDCILLEYCDCDAVFEDTTENLWGIPAEECDLNVGDICVLVMDSMGTPTIYDDTIISVHSGSEHYGLPVAYANYHDFKNLYVE